MPFDTYTRDVLKSILRSVGDVSGRLDRLIGLADRPRKDDVQTIDPKKAPTNEEYAAIGKMLFALHIAPTPSNKNHAEKKWYQTFEGWKKALEITAILGGLFYAWVTYRQWRDASKNFTLDERAWVGVGDYTFDYPEHGGMTSYIIQVANSGKTPALFVTFQSNVIFRSNPFIENREDLVRRSGMGHDAAQQGTVFPTKGFPGKSTNFYPDSPERTAMRESIATGKTVATFYGEITYQDIFRKKHFTHFCVDVTGNMHDPSPCPFYNDTDETDETKQKH